MSGRRGSRTPKASQPTRFRDGVPHRWQSFQSGAGRVRTGDLRVAQSGRVPPGTAALRSTFAADAGSAGIGRSGHGDPQAMPFELVMPPRSGGGVRTASGPGRRRTCTSPGKNRELCRIELRSRRCDRQESNLRSPAFQAGALPAELRPHECALVSRGASPSITSRLQAWSLGRDGGRSCVCEARPPLARRRGE
jgi:hypothetical protein